MQKEIYCQQCHRLITGKPYKSTNWHWRDPDNNWVCEECHKNQAEAEALLFKIVGKCVKGIFRLFLMAAPGLALGWFFKDGGTLLGFERPCNGYIAIIVVLVYIALFLGWLVCALEKSRAKWKLAKLFFGYGAFYLFWMSLGGILVLILGVCMAIYITNAYYKEKAKQEEFPDSTPAPTAEISVVADGAANGSAEAAPTAAEKAEQ